MIIARKKPLEEIERMLAGHRKVLVLGCRGCVTVCLAGGEREVAEIAALLRLRGKNEGVNSPVAWEVKEGAVERQCEWEFVERIRGEVEKVDAVLSLACGIGVQALAEKYPDLAVYPGVDTVFLGLPLKSGVWAERCLACGSCILDRTGGICPIARCAKNLLNGPCGGSQGGKCEIDPRTDCAWQLIYDRLSRLGHLEWLMEIQPPRDWSRGRDGGPRSFVREDWEEDVR